MFLNLILSPMKQISIDFQAEAIRALIFLSQFPEDSFYSFSIWKDEILLQGHGSLPLIHQLTELGFAPHYSGGNYLILKNEYFRICLADYNEDGNFIYFKE